MPQLVAQSLIDEQGRIWLPYDRQNRGLGEDGFKLLADCRPVLNADIAPFRLDYRKVRRLLVINGMGVALGDSVIGLTALDWIKRHYPAVHITLWRGATTPDFVEEIYALAGHVVDAIEYLPQPVRRFDEFDTVIDLADFMFRPAFDRLPMIDFFLESLGIAAGEVSPAEKTNRWLAAGAASAPAAEDAGYVLFCPRASCALRSIPAETHAALIDSAAQAHGLEILGFTASDSAVFTDVSAGSSSLADFIALIRGARHVVSTDSAAVHIAAAFGKPTTAFFVSIDPALRTRYYPHCQSIDLDHAGLLRGLHDTPCPEKLAYARSLWQLAPPALAVEPADA